MNIRGINLKTPKISPWAIANFALRFAINICCKKTKSVVIVTASMKAVKKKILFRIKMRAGDQKPKPPIKIDAITKLERPPILK